MENRLAHLGRAIDNAIKQSGETQSGLAKKLGVDTAQVSRMINGKMPTLALERVAEIEDALNLKRGLLLRAGGYVDEEVTAIEVIAGNHDLSDEAKTALRLTLEAFERSHPRR